MKFKSIFQDSFTEQFCYRCGRPYPSDWHHIFNASNKKRSEKYGAMIKVCRTCHDYIHRYAMNEYRKKAQQRLMTYYGMTEDEFREIFGKSYLEVEE